MHYLSNLNKESQMKNRRCAISILLLLLIIQEGCVVIGYRNHFSRDLTPEQKSKVVWGTSDDWFLSIENDGKLYAINGKQMQKLVQAHSKVIVYQWSPHCSSEYCLPLSTIQTLCDKNGITLFVVADYFHEAFSQNQVLSYPLFIADEKYYNTDICNKLEKLFYIDLLGEKTYNETENISWYRYAYFENGEFVKYCRDPYAEFGDGGQ